MQNTPLEEVETRRAHFCNRYAMQKRQHWIQLFSARMKMAEK
jgi:hypothetical protein